jgi:hypothetical protein
MAQKITPDVGYVPCTLMIAAVHPSWKAAGLHPVSSSEKEILF